MRKLPEESGDLLEIVLDLGREPEARFEGSEVILSPTPVSLEDIDYVADRVGTFGGDNRGGDRADPAPDQRHPQSRR